MRNSIRKNEIDETYSILKKLFDHLSTRGSNIQGTFTDIQMIVLDDFNAHNNN